MKNGQDMELGFVALDEHGRVVLSDADLQTLDQVQLRGYAGGDEGENNRGCTNPSGCGSTTNSGCTNTGCGGSTNYTNCINKVVDVYS